MIRQKTILWLNQFAVTPDQGGGTRHLELSKELVKKGWKVILLASDFGLQSRSYAKRVNSFCMQPVVENIDGVQLVWLWAAPYSLNNWRRLWNWVSFWLSAVRYGKSLSAIDLVIGSSPQPLAALAGLQISKRKKVPFWLEVRDLWPESLEAATGKKGGLFYWLLEILSNHLYRQAEKIIHLAKGVMDLLAEHGFSRERFLFLPNGADLSQFPNPPVASHEFPLRLIYLGAHGPANGLEAVLEAAWILRSQKQIYFELIGDGPAKKSLQEMASRRSCDHLYFRPSVPKREAIRALQGGSAGLMVLRDEPLFRVAVSPNKLFDYMAAGIPLISNVQGEVAQIIAEAGSGLLAKDGTGQSLAETILRFAELSPAQRDKMGKAGRIWMGRHRSRSVIAGLMHQELLRALSPAG